MRRDEKQKKAIKDGMAVAGIVGGIVGGLAHKKRSTTPKSRSANGTSANTKQKRPLEINNKTYHNKEEWIAHLKELLEEKYALEQTMARMTGGKTGVVELKSVLFTMWSSGDSNGEMLYESMFQKKSAEILKCYQRIEEIQKEVEKGRKKRNKQTMTQEEKELYDLIEHIAYDDFYKTLKKENENFEKEMKGRHNE